MKGCLRYFGLVLMALILPITATSQIGNTSKIDSLKKELKLAKADTTKSIVLSELSLVLSKVDSTATFKTAFDALALSKKNKFRKGEAAALFSIGGAYMDYFDLEKADTYLDMGLPIIQDVVKKDSSASNLRLWLRGHYFKAINHSYKGEVNQEMELTDKVIPIAQKLNDLDFMTKVYTNLGVTKMNLGQYADAYNNYKQSDGVNALLASPKRSIFTNLMFAQLLFEMDSITQMLPYLDKTEKLLQTDPNALDWQLYHTLKGLYFSGIDQYKEALASLDRAKALILANQMNQEYLNLLQRYALINEKHGDYNAAIEHTTSFIKIANQKNSPRTAFKGYFKRAEYEAANHNYKNAYEDFVRAVDIYDSLETVTNIQNIKALELKYDTAEKEKEILALSVKNEARKSETYLLLGLATLLGTLLFSGYFVYNQRLRKARKKAHVQETEMNLLKQEQQNKIFSAMIEGQEKERKRLAIDLHDGLGGRLSGISLNLSKLDKDEPKEYPKDQLQKVMKDLNDSLSELRNIARNMMPETLVKFGLQAALKDYCSSMNGTDTKVTLQFYGSEKGMDLQQQVTLYRVIQELINNAVKHANASEVLVQYMREGNKVDITVEDNGIGMANELLLQDNPNGMGLSNLRTRVAYLKGDLDFHSQKNEGTTVNIHITVDAA